MTKVVVPGILVENQAPVCLGVLVINVLEFLKIVKIVMKLLTVKLDLDPNPHPDKELVKVDTLLVSRSEYPREKPFLLTMVSYLKK
jgi:hypothetical protein